MKRWRTRILLLAGGATLAIAIPAIAQRDRSPQSLLPPGFGEKNPAPKEKTPGRPGSATPAAPATAPAAEGTSPAAPAAAAPAVAGVVESDEPAVENNVTDDLENQAENEQPRANEIPDFAR